MLTTTASTLPAADAGSRDGFDILDVCHRHTLMALGKLSALIARLDKYGADDEARALAEEIGRYFSTTSREHHEDEERHVFPKILAGRDTALKQTVLRLQQDHFWLEEDWREMAPLLDAVACGQSWVDLDTLRESAAVFSALSHDHIALEEACIYPEARARLHAGEGAEMGREMAARRRMGVAGHRERTA